MTGATFINQARGLTDLTIVELAIMIAVLRHGPVPAAIILPALSEWFGKCIGMSDIQPGIRRLIHTGFLHDDSGTLHPERKAQESVVTLYAMFVRMIGSDVIDLMNLKDPSFIDMLRKGK